eukprot:scaffold1350_cov56-Cyclotella_meneghiniana.AAC.18
MRCGGLRGGRVESRLVVCPLWAKKRANHHIKLLPSAGTMDGISTYIIRRRNNAEECADVPPAVKEEFNDVVMFQIPIEIQIPQKRLEILSDSVPNSFIFHSPQPISPVLRFCASSAFVTKTQN